MHKEFVLTVSREMIQRYGLQHLLMDDLARQCGMSKKTIYEMFGSKEALMVSLGQIYIEQERNKFLEQLQQLTELPEQLNFIVQYLIDLGLQIPVEELEFLKKKFRTNYNMLQQHFSDILERLQSILRLGIEQGKVDAGLNVDIHTSLLIAQLQYLHTHHRKLIQQHPLEQWRQHISQMFLNTSLKS